MRDKQTYSSKDVLVSLQVSIIMKMKRAIIFFFFVSIVIFIFYFTKSTRKEAFLIDVDINITFKYPVPQEEVDFPLAFTISVYKDPVQFLRLLKLIYRPFNLYCVHVDKKSHVSFHSFVRNLTRLYSNIIIPKNFIEVTHSMFSVLESELLCMEAVYKEKVQWKYLINLTGQELPLKTNLEIVRILKRLKGANLMEKVNVNKERIPKGINSPPHGIRLWKGAVHIIVVRDFVRFALYDTKSQDLLKYLRNTLVPDETFFSTLNHEHSLRAPGGYNGNYSRDPVLYPFLNRHKIWYLEGTCYGQFLREICIFSMEDVPEIISRENMKFFANKFVVGLNDNVYDYLEKWFEDRIKTVYTHPESNPFINLSYYTQLTVVRNHF